MADVKISALPAATTPLAGTELVPIVQSGVNKKTTVADIVGYQQAYGAWDDTTTQTGSTTVGTVVTLNTQSISDGITLVDGSKFTVPNTGVYNFQFSAQLKNTDNAQHIVTIWVRKNGTDIPNSATNVTVPARKTSNIYGYLVASWNFFFDLVSNDYVELVWLPASTLVTMETLPQSTTPAYPEIPSIIVTMNQVA